MLPAMRLALLTPVLLLAIGPACGAEPRGADIAPPPGRTGVAPAPVSTPPPAKPAATPSSPEVEAYLARGLPSIERPWAANDYEAAAEVLTKIAAEDLGRLPRASGPGSRQVFARLTARENFAIFRNKTLPHGARMDMAVATLNAFRRISKIYVAAWVGGHPLEPESLALLATSVHLMAEQWDLVDEFAATLDRKDPTYAARMAGLERMKVGTAEVVAGTVRVFEEPHQRENLLRFAQELRADLPRLTTRIGAMNRDEAKRRLAAVKAAQSDRAYAAALGDLVVSLGGR
jgi:hypothetical protein